MRPPQHLFVPRAPLIWSAMQRGLHPSTSISSAARAGPKWSCCVNVLPLEVCPKLFRIRISHCRSSAQPNMLSYLGTSTCRMLSKALPIMMRNQQDLCREG